MTIYEQAANSLVHAASNALFIGILFGLLYMLLCAIQRATHVPIYYRD